MTDTVNRILISDFESLVRARLKKTLSTAPAPIRAQTIYLSKSQGKNIRAFSLAVCASDGETLRDEAVGAASAIEMLHLATLVHDDIIDSADKRRGVASLHKVFGEKVAVLCGDYLLSAALVSAFELSPSRFRRSDELGTVLAKQLSEVCLGELRQNDNYRNFSISEREYFKIIEGKTAALFKAAYLSGFMLSDEADEYAEQYSELGKLTGLMFQLSDDLLDYELSEKQAKKPVLADYTHGVITLPLIYTMKNDPDLKTIAENGITPDKLRKMVQDAGGIDYTERKIDNLLKKAEKIIKNLSASDSKKELLYRIAMKSAGKN